MKFAKECNYNFYISTFCRRGTFIWTSCYENKENILEGDYIFIVA